MNLYLKKMVLLGIQIDNVNMTEAVDKIIEMTNQYKYDYKNRLVVTANVDFMINAHKSPDKKTGAELLSVLRKADLVTADGMPLVWLSKLLGNPLKERVTGADMVPKLAQEAAKAGKSIFLLGGKDGSAKNTAEILKSKSPSLTIAGYDSSFIEIDNLKSNKDLITKINAIGADILLIALGNPKQELWFKRYGQYLRVPVSIGVGGTFEFISGVTSRAPMWMQKSGTEWIFRILQDPGRLIKRYALGLLYFNQMILPLLFLRLFFNQNKHYHTDRKSKLLPFFSKTNQGIAVNWQDIGRSSQITLILNQLNSVKMVSLDFKALHLFSPKDLLNLMNILLSAIQYNVMIEIKNLRLLPALTLRANRLFDLIRTANSPQQVEFGSDRLKRPA